MSTAAELQWRQLPLTGTTLIEASAGTGKTYNIALLYLRLLLETELGVRQILVTTFTDAAAQELKARIRLRVHAAERALAAPGATDDVSVREFLQERVAAVGVERVLARLRLALSELDLAPISTIHGFCRKVLTDFPFDTGVPFTLGEIVDERALLRECVEDFWRGRFLGKHLDPWEAAFVLGDGLGPLAAHVAVLMAAGSAQLQWDNSVSLRQWWAEFVRANHQSLRELVADGTAFKNAERSQLRKALRELIAGVESDDPGRVPWSVLAEQLTPAKVAYAWKKSATTPLDQRPDLQSLLAAAPLFQNVARQLRLEVALACAEFVRGELARRLRVRGQTTFTQLIAEVHERLHGVHSDALAERLGTAWPAALIDEFQDTDAQQWAIFQRLYATGAPRTLVLIGDPKQAIYGFRGGDIHTYLAARQGLPAGRVVSIRQNFRSHPALLSALNKLYALSGAAAFADSGIGYVPVQAGEPERWSGYPQALRLRLLHNEQATLALRDAQALEACANDIAHLLADPAQQIDGRPIAPGDIAVLLDTNRRIVELRDLLKQRGVPVVGGGRSSVIQTVWADDVQLLLHALLNPDDEYAVRGALASALLGVSAADLARMAEDPRAWDEQLQCVADWRALWERRGILAVIENLVLLAAPRLLARSDGERALTDLRHLGEVLQNAATECYGPEELYAWFVRARSEGGADEEASREMQLRIESESARVQLLTVHASKGLQFPIVFLPMAWRYRQEPSASARAQFARYHDAAQRACVDLGSPEFAAHKEAEQREDLQERMRKLYVGLTRAERLCQIYAFALPPPAAGVKRGELEVWLDAALAAVPTAAASTPWDALALAVPELAICSEPVGYASHPAPPAADTTRSARTPLPAARARYGLYSFTALTSHAPTAIDSNRGAEDESARVPDPQADPDAIENPHPQLLALASVKGPRFGDAIHQLLELGPGAAHYTQQSARIADALLAQAVQLPPEQSAAQLTAIATMLERTRASELGRGLSLATLPATAQRAEFEFAFVLDQARWGRLPALLQQHGMRDWWPLADDGRTLRGLMKGYVDLVFEWEGRFHVLDYKTNWLGDRLSGYQGVGLEDAMRTHRYGLQALIYSVALHRYLAHRLPDYRPEQHLGDSWYLFVRALGLGPDAGVWRRRFPTALIEALDALFDGAQVQS